MNDNSAKLQEAVNLFFTSINKFDEYLKEKGTDRRIKQFGDIGELIAAAYYDIELFEDKNHACSDGKSSDGKEWQIKSSFTESRSSVNCPKEGNEPYGYLALVIKKDCNPPFEEIYNGPWEKARELLSDSMKKKEKDRTIAKGLLKKLNNQIPPEEKLPRRK